MNRRKDSKRDAGMIQLGVRPTRQKVIYIITFPPSLVSVLTNWAGLLCINCLLTNSKKCDIMAGRPRPRRPKFPLYHTLSNLSSKISHKFIQIFYPEFVQHYHLHFTPGCGIIMMSRGERNKPLLGLSPSEVKLDTPHKKHERTSRKPLDKLLNVCYNKGTKVERGKQKKTSPISKKGIDKSKGL